MGVLLALPMIKGRRIPPVSLGLRGLMCLGRMTRRSEVVGRWQHEMRGRLRIRLIVGLLMRDNILLVEVG